MQTWSVGILCYNEAETLAPLTAKLRGVLQQITSAFEIIIVDDYSTDGSREIAIELQKKYPEVKLILHEVNKGIGGAERSFYALAKNENIGIIPGDGQFDVNEYLQFADIPIDRFISFYRRENTSYSLFRNMLSLVNKKINAIFIGINIKDVNWTKILKKADLDQLDLQLTSSLVESEMTAKLLFMGKKVIEVESKYLPRTYGQSKGSSSAIVKKALKDTWLLLSILREFKKQHSKRT